MWNRIYCWINKILERKILRKNLKTSILRHEGWYIFCKYYLEESRCNQQDRRRPLVGSRWWSRPPRFPSCWPWNRACQPRERCGSCQPWSPGSRSGGRAWRRRPWGKPSPCLGGELRASWGRTPWTRDGEQKTYDETENEIRENVNLITLSGLKCTKLKVINSF